MFDGAAGAGAAKPRTTTAVTIAIIIRGDISSLPKMLCGSSLVPAQPINADDSRLFPEALALCAKSYGAQVEGAERRE
jgi:hypothetical protein